MEIMKLKVKGMHCKACEMLIKDILGDENIIVINISSEKGFLEIESKDKQSELKNIRKLLAQNNYSIIE